MAHGFTPDPLIPLLLTLVSGGKKKNIKNEDSWIAEQLQIPRKPISLELGLKFSFLSSARDKYSCSSPQALWPRRYHVIEQNEGDSSDVFLEYPASVRNPEACGLCPAPLPKQ